MKVLKIISVAIIAGLAIVNICKADPGNIISYDKINWKNFQSDDPVVVGIGIKILQDLNKSGRNDLSISTLNRSTSEGEVYILMRDSAGNIIQRSRIARNEGGFVGDFSWTNSLNGFGQSITTMSDLSGNGIDELVVGNPMGDYNDRGEFYLMFLNEEGTVDSFRRFGPPPEFGPNERDIDFANGVANIGDVNNNGIDEVVVGSSKKSVWVHFFNPDGTLNRRERIKLGEGILNDEDEVFGFGRNVAGIGDVNGDGIPDLLVGAPFSDIGGQNRGAIYILMLNQNGSLKDYQRISQGEGGFADSLNDEARFGWGITGLNDLNGSGVPDIAVGAPRYIPDSVRRGGVWILFLNNDGTVESQKKITQGTENFDENLDDTNSNFGIAISGGKDLNGDRIPGLVIGASSQDREEDPHDPGRPNSGAIYMFNLDGEPLPDDDPNRIAEPESKLPSFKVYPNPASHSISIESATPPEMVRIRDLTGRMLWETQPGSLTEIPMPDIVPGMYLIELCSDRQCQTEKLMVE